MTPIRRIAAASASMMLAVALIASSAAPASATVPAEVLLTGLNSPKGITIAISDNVVIGQGAFGPPSPAFVYLLRGPSKGETFDLTQPYSLVDVAPAGPGVGWALGAEGVLYFGRGGILTPVLDIKAYQAHDPDPYDQDGDPVESNPYGLGVMPNGDALVADAANNDIVRVKRDGSATTIARWDLTMVKTDLTGDPTLPPELPAEAVPTSVRFGPGGDIYVGQLMGFPFRPGSSKVWRINPRAGVPILCSTTVPDPNCSVYADDFTAIQDISFSPNGRILYVYELAKDGVSAFEEGFNTGVFPPAVLLQQRVNGERKELAKGQLSQPGGVTTGRNGAVFVTDGMFSDGRLLRIHD